MRLSSTLMVVLGAGVMSACAAADPVALAARCQGASGYVTLGCAVYEDGTVFNCRILEESPRSCGFGQAALLGARGAVLSPEFLAGARGGRVVFTTRFAPKP